MTRPAPAAVGEASTVATTRSSLSWRERPTAVVAQSDILAAGVLRAAETLGLCVPEDVSVAGFDGAELPYPTKAPNAGQHTDEVLTKVLGYDAAKVAALREGGVAY